MCDLKPQPCVIWADDLTVSGEAIVAENEFYACVTVATVQVQCKRARKPTTSSRPPLKPSICLVFRL